MSGERGTWQSWMQAGVFPHVRLPLLSICAWISLLFFAVELFPTFVGIPGFLGNLCCPVPEENFQNTLIFCFFTGLSPCMRAVFQQAWRLPACFQMQFQILRFPFTVLGDVAFGCVISLQICSSMLVFLVLTVLKEFSLLREAVLEVFLVRVYL